MNVDGGLLKVTYRRADVADLPRIFEVFRAALDSYLVPAGQPPMPPEDDQSPAYRHYLRHDGERFWVAEVTGTAESGWATGAPGAADAPGAEIVAWGCGLLRGDWWFLSSLFVLPGAQGRGVGARLFELALTGAPAGAVRATVTDSIQPVSNTLYARRGLLPREVLVGFGGRPRSGLGLPRLGGLHPEPLTTASIPDLGEIDGRVTGLDRSIDHAYYLATSGRRGWLFRRAGRPVAYVMVRADGWVGPAASLRAPDMQPVTSFAIAQLAAEGASRLRGGVTASCEGAQRAFWEAGLVFESTPALLLASAPFGRLDRYLAASYGMF